MKNTHFSEDEGDAGHSAVSGPEPGHRAHLLRGDVPLLPHTKTDHQRLRGGQHPLYPPLQGAGHGQDTSVVHVCHRHSTAAHGEIEAPHFELRPIPKGYPSHFTNPLNFEGAITFNHFYKT